MRPFPCLTPTRVMRPWPPAGASRRALLACWLAAVFALFATLSATTPVRAQLDAGQRALGLLCSGKPVPGDPPAHSEHCALCAQVAPATGAARPAAALDAGRSHERASGAAPDGAPASTALPYAARAPPARG